MGDLKKDPNLANYPSPKLCVVLFPFLGWRHEGYKVFKGSKYEYGSYFAGIWAPKVYTIL